MKKYKAIKCVTNLSITVPAMEHLRRRAELGHTSMSAIMEELIRKDVMDTAGLLKDPKAMSDEELQKALGIAPEMEELIEERIQRIMTGTWSFTKQNDDE